MKNHLYIILCLLFLFTGNLSSQVAVSPVPYTDGRDSVFSPSKGSYKPDIINGDTIFTYVPEIWGLNSEAEPVKSSGQKKSLQSRYSGYSDLSHIPTSHAIDKDKDPGDIRIVQGGAAGALTYTVPFDIYLTQSGFNPEICLAYNSQSNNGPAGFGWQIGGLSSISATNSAQYFDNANAPAKLSRSSAFLLDGIRLIDLKTGTGETINYETERGKIKVTAYLSGDHIKYFIVKYPDGKTGTFGYTTNTVSKAGYPLTRLEDLRGNLIDYSYSEDNRTCYLDEIRYGGKGASVAHFASIKLTYENRHDVTSLFIDGQELKAAKRLKEVNTYFDDREIRKYRLTYDTSSPISLLKQIDCLSGDRSLNPLIFYYGENQRIVQFEKSEVFLYSYFSNSSVPDLHLSKGKFGYGQNDDGLISYPNINNWDIIKIKKNWKGQVIAYQYGSKYAADQSLLIYDELSSGWVSPAKLTTEEGFLQMSAADVDGDGTDELVKINSTVVSSSTEQLTFKVYSIIQSMGQRVAKLKYQFSADFGGVCSWEGLNSPPWRNYIVGDFLGTGKQSVLCLSYNKNAKNETVSSWATLVDIDGRTKSATHDKTCFSYDPQDRVYSMDFDGDGKMDICHISSGGTRIYSFNLSGQLIEIAYISSIKSGELKGRELLLGDMNGDGKTDMVLSPKKNDYIYKTTEIPCGVCDGCRNGGGIIRPEEPYPILRNLDESDSHNHTNHIELDKDSINISSFALQRPIDAVDSYCSNPQIYREKIYNASSTIWSIYYSTGKSISLKTRDIIRNEGDIKFALQDMNGDNIPDLVVNNSGTISMYLADNGILNTKAESQTCSVEGKAHFIAGSIEQGYKMSQLFSLYDYKLVPVTFTRNDAKQRLLTGVVNSLGVVNRHRFADMQGDEAYSKGTPCTYPYMNLSGKLYILKEQETYLDKSLVSGASFTYEKGVLDLRGRGFLGFEKVTVHDRIKNSNTTRVFDPYNFGVLVSEDSPLSAATYKTSVSVATNKIASIRTTSMSAKDKLKDITVTHAYSYDGYDNITREVVDYGQGIKTTIGNVYNNYSGTPYRLGLLCEQHITDERNGSSVTKKLQVSYDAKYQPVSRKELYNGNQVSEEIMVYNSLYNIVEKKARPYSSTGWLSVKFDYDRYGRQTRKTDALGLTEDYAYDAKGMPSSIKNHKGQLTVYEYNAWNQKVKETYPDGTRLSIKTQWAPAISSGIVTDTNIGTDTHVHELNLSAPVTRGGVITACESVSLKPGFSYNSANGGNLVLKIDPTIHVASPSQYTNAGTASYLVTTERTGAPLTQTYYDALGRVLRTGTMRFDGKYLYTDNIYDSWGRIQKTSLPFRDASQVLWNTYKYDNYDRMTCLSYASGKEDTYSYENNSVTSVIDNVSTTKIYDPSGEVINITDPSGTIKFYLRPDRQTERIVSPGGIVTGFEYDAYGRQTAIVDASAGRKTYGYDAYGNINRETNANGSSIGYTYDIYGRITKKEITGEQTITYDFNADGLLTGETSTNGTSKAYTYDAYFRMATEKESVPDGKWFQKAYTYSNNNLSSTAYSANTGNIATENYTYSNGSLTGIKLNNATSIWKLVSENNLGIATRAETGILSRSYTFDQYGHPVARNIKNGSTLIQDFSYNFNAKTGNLNWRKDNGRKLQEDFVYDKLNRLTHFNGNVITYDVKGNITDHSGVGQFGYSREKPFAIEAVSPYGNSMPMRNQQITYNAQMRPSSITENGYAADFIYNGDGDRVRMRIRKGNADELVRHYIGDQYEVETGVAGTKERLYLGGDAYTAAAVYIKDGSGGWTVNFIGRDYLGSITHVISANGQLRQELSYDPWGRLRNPGNHELYAAGNEPVLLLGRGFTGHEHLTMFGLVNMNARLYDPVLGRFLSPDPYVQNPFFSQNYNRYSYGWNNPLRFTDPDGEWIHIAIGALAGGVFNVIVNWDNINNFGQGLSYFGMGAAGGAVMATGNIVAGGILMSGGNSILTQGFQNGFDNIDFNQVGMSATMGGITSYLGGQMGQYLQGPLSKLFSSVASPMLREGLTYGTNGALTGFTLGTGMAMAGGEELDDAMQIGGKSAIWGFGAGFGYGMYSGYKYAQTNNLNPVNGKPNQVAPDSDNNSLTPYYPPNNGATSAGWEYDYLNVGDMVDRYGSEYGTFVSKPGTPVPMRALPPNNSGVYNTYEILKPIPVMKSTIAPAFGQPGGGIQYKLPFTINELKGMRYMK